MTSIPEMASDEELLHQVERIQAVARGIYARKDVKKKFGFERKHKDEESRRNFIDYIKQHKPKTPPPSFIVRTGDIDVYKKWKVLHPSVRDHPVWWIEDKDDWEKIKAEVPGVDKKEEALTASLMFNIKLMFASADVENVGYLGRKQLKTLLELLSLDFTPETLANMFVDMDANGDNEIEWCEFLIGIASHIPEESLEQEVRVGAMGFRIWTRDEVLGCGSNCLVIVCIAVGLTITVYFQFVLVPLFTAYMLTFVLAPIMNLLEHRPIWCGAKALCNQQFDDGTYIDPQRQEMEEKEGTGAACGACMYDMRTAGKFPHAIAMLAALFLLFGSLGGVMIMASNEVSALMDDEEFMGTLEDAVDDAYQSLNDSGFEIIRDTREGYYQYEIAAYIDMMVTMFANVVTVILLFMFIIIEKTEPTMFGTSSGVATRIETMINFYIQLKTVISFMTGFLTAVILMILQIRLAFLFGIMAFILNFIPSIGSIIAAMLPIPILIVQPMPTWRKVTAFAGPGFVQFVIGNVVEPVVFGSALNMTTLAILLGLVMWGSLWGIMGAIMSVPLLGVQQKVLDSVNHPWAKVWVSLVREDPTFDEDAEQAKRVYEKRNKQPSGPVEVNPLNESDNDVKELN